jgi:transcriptional regulator with XRE-family HTH domain
MTATARRRVIMNLKAFRAKKGWSQADLSKRVKLSREYIARLELGQHDPPLSTLCRLAEVFGVPVTRLLQ